MKKIVTFLIVFYLAMIPIKAYASSANVEINVKGQVKKGEDINILVNINNVKNLYAASVDFIYDTEVLKVNSIHSTNFITKNSNDIMEFGGDTDKNGNTASYSFTFLGDKEGIDGSGTLAIIEATVISDEVFKISNEDMKVKLVKRVGENVENYEYNFLGYDEAAKNNQPNEENNNDKDNNNSDEPSKNTDNTNSDNNNSSNKKQEVNNIGNEVNSGNKKQESSDGEEGNNKDITNNVVNNSEDDEKYKEENGESQVSNNENINNNVVDKSENAENSREETTVQQQLNSTSVLKNNNKYYLIGGIVVIVLCVAGAYLYKTKLK